jgi:predicted aspartyl protease
MKNEWQKEIFKNHEYWGKIIAISDDKIIAVADNYNEIIQKASKIKKDCIYFSAPRRPDLYRILPLKLKSMKLHEWYPVHSVKFFLDDNSYIIEDALIDSGADISAVGKEFGEKLGFTKGKHEIVSNVQGIGGSVDFLMREAEIEINDFRFMIRFAWLQDENINDIIIGREIVFDLFDIEFKQADEEIIFRKR